MEDINTEQIANVLYGIRDWAVSDILVPWTLAQLVVAVVLVLVAGALRKPARRLLHRATNIGPLDGRVNRVTDSLTPLAFPLTAIILLWLAVGIANNLDTPSRVISIVASLFSAWVLIRFVSGIAGDSALTRFVSFVAWTVAALNIVGLLDPTVTTLDRASFELGDLRISALTILKGVAVLGFLLWLAVTTSRFLERRIKAVSDLTPSVQVLLINLSRIILIIVAIVAGISSVGIDLTAFAVFTGALGVGIGFGLQKVVGNFVSGIIILLDKSVKPGDVVAIGNNYGRISSLGARYVSVVTPDAHEYLIPNEDFITTQVVNWSYSDQNIRLSADVGVHHRSDVHRAIEICLEAAGEVDRILKDPPPKCFLNAFGESSVDLLVSYWINDPMNGTINVRSALLLNIWDKFHAEGIEISYPQRDLYIKEMPPDGIDAPNPKAET